MKKHPQTGEKVITIKLPWPPSGNHSVKHTRAGKHYLTKHTSNYHTDVAWIVRQAGLAQALPGPLEVRYTFTPPDRRRRDMDNVIKSLGDALTRAGLWADDSGAVIRRMVVEWTPPQPPNGHVTVQVLAHSDAIRA